MVNRMDKRCLTISLHDNLRPTQTERDYTTRRDFLVFKCKQDRQYIEILQDMQTKQLKLPISCRNSLRVSKSRPICVGIKSRLPAVPR